AQEKPEHPPPHLPPPVAQTREAHSGSAEPVNDRTGDRLKPEARMLGYLIEYDTSRSKSGNRLNERARIGVTGIGSHCSRNRECLSVHATRPDKTGKTKRERSRLVEDHRVDFGEALKTATVLHNNAVLE